MISVVVVEGWDGMGRADRTDDEWMGRAGRDETTGDGGWGQDDKYHFPDAFQLESEYSKHVLSFFYDDSWPNLSAEC